MEKLTTNVLIAGKSGVGKSSLLNYLFGKPLQETGSGFPVTKPGVYPFSLEYDDAFIIKIHDTWGLEPDKANEWRKLIVDEVQKHDKENIKEWFNTIIYCLNSNSRIVEDFEIENLKALQAEKNNIVVVLTHCEHGKGEMIDHCMTNRLIRDANIPQEDILYVNSVLKKTIGGTKQIQFGKEEVFVSIIRNLWGLLKEKVPFRVKKNVEKQLEKFQKDIYRSIDNKILTFRRNRVYKEFEQEVGTDFERLEKLVSKEVNMQFRDAVNYFNALSNKYASIVLLDQSTMKTEIVSFKTETIFEEDIKQIIHQIEKSKNVLFDAIKLKDNVNLKRAEEVLRAAFKYLSSSRKVKKELKLAVGKYVMQAYDIIINEIEEIEKELRCINIEGISQKHLDSQRS